MLAHCIVIEGCVRRRRYDARPMEIAAFQSLMDELYGVADRERGTPATVAWLAEEVGELAQAVRKGTPAQQLHELGDVLAWLASLANQLGLTLEDAARRYVDHPPV
jgi:NTP pyrophosphatase (non-canonical NTP hydrolase)